MADKKKPSNGKTESQQARPAASVSLALPIEWHFPDSLSGRYANQAMVQIGPTETNISFFEIRPPLLIGTEEQMQEQASKIKSIQAECVARIIVANEFVPMLTKILTDTLAQRMAAQTATDE